jgi:uncharacterized protein (DUF608 family)
MRRRDLLAGLAGAGALSIKPLAAEPREGVSQQAPWPFVSSGDLGRWQKLEAVGFKSPVPGCVYDGARLESGIPLGGLGTGYLRLDGDGKLGVCSIFNKLVPPENVHRDWLEIGSGTRKVPLSAAHISYWGHFPVADLRAQLPELPVQLGIRAFAPFLVGDAAVSNTPAALFELSLKNTSAEAIPLELSLKLPEVPSGASVAVLGDGVVPQDVSKGAYSIACRVPPDDSRRVRFVVGWYAPTWRDSGSEPHTNRYAQRFQNAQDVANLALRNFDGWLSRVLAWQAVLYESDLPDWLQDALIQSFYDLPKNSVWIARTRHDQWWSDDGWFTHSESHTGCPIVETMVCRIHGHFPLLYFFPSLEQTTLDAFRHFQIADGEVPFAFGQPTSMRDPRYHCQHPLNSGQYAQMVYQLYARTNDGSLLTRFYESAKRAIRYQLSLDDDDCGLVHDQPHVRAGEDWPANQFYDTWPWEGVSSYVAGVWLATLRAGHALAKAANDSEFAAECASRFAKGQSVYQELLWNGTYYRLWNNRSAKRVSEVCLANQMMGEWCAKVAGLESVFPQDRVNAALNAIERMNFRETSYGFMNGSTPDGEPYHSGHNGEADFSSNIFFGENLCTAMTFLYHGRRETGIEAARRLYEAVALKTVSPWNQRCLLSGETGLPLWGDDYYSNVAIWAVPMALGRQSVAEYTSHGLLPDMIRAGSRA